MKKIMAFLLAATLAIGLSLPAFAATSHPDEAKAVLDCVNQERRAAGLDPLTWEGSLVGFATTRAKEIIRKWSHTRPNGDKATDTKGVNGENLAYGTDSTAEEVVAGWMDSPGHRANILDPHYTSLAVACVEENKDIAGYGEVPHYYWVQLFHSDKKVRPDGTVVDADGKVFTAPKTTTTDKTTTSAKTPAAAPSSGTAVDAKTAADLLKKNNGVATVSNRTTVSPAVLAEMVKVDKNAVLVAQTTFSDSKKAQGQITLKAADFAKIKTDLKLGVSVESAKTSGVLKNFKTWYSNANIAVIQMEQTGTLPVAVQVVAKVDLTGFDAKNLVFYSYDSGSKKVQKIETPNYKVDKNGFLHFQTSQTGNIIVTDAPLAKR